MQIKKTLMAPALMVAAVFSSNAARAQNIVPQNPTSAVPPNNIGAALPDAPLQNIDAQNVDAAPKPLNLKPYSALPMKPETDFRMRPSTTFGPVDPDRKPEDGDNGNAVALFAGRHLVNGQQGVDLGASVTIKHRFTVMAGTTDNAYHLDDQRWQTGGMNLKPEITIPGAWNTENSRMTLKPKGRGFVIGFKMTIP